MGIGVRAAQVAFRNAAEGKPWKGHHLPVVALKGQAVGAHTSAAPPGSRHSTETAELADAICSQLGLKPGSLND